MIITFLTIGNDGRSKNISENFNSLNVQMKAHVKNGDMASKIINPSTRCIQEDKQKSYHHTPINKRNPKNLDSELC